ncbi:MAG TPA: hypothetical protein PK581_08320 [Caldisericia bacterium]|nr:hypothetical protein [Caldisericia bacterium]
MTKWKIEKLVYQLHTPLRIGRTSRGFILQTRYYIPGTAMWGAITNKIGRSIVSANANPYKHFMDIGTELMNIKIFASYFFPAIFENDKCYCLKPRYRDNKGLEYECPHAINKDRCIDKEEFESIFISSITQTAINPNCNSAEDGSLHETEFIKNVIHLNSKKLNVFFVGYLIYRDDIDLSSVDFNGSTFDLFKVISELVVGGDRKYGYGLMRLVKRVEDEKSNFLFDHCIKLISDVPSDNPEFKIQASEINSKEVPMIHVPAHFIVNDSLLKNSSNVDLYGDIEPMVGLLTNEKGPGQEPTQGKCGWVPGSTLNLKNGANKIKLNKYGTLEL